MNQQRRKFLDFSDSFMENENATPMSESSSIKKNTKLIITSTPIIGDRVELN